MNFATYFFLSVMSLAVARARMPLELSRILGLNSTPQDSGVEVQPSTGHPLQDRLAIISDTLLSEDQDMHFDGIESPNLQLPAAKMLSVVDDTKMVPSLEDARMNFNAGNIELYAPPPVRNAECYVEYHVTRRAPGRCIKLGGKLPACQTDEYLGINNSDCS